MMEPRASVVLTKREGKSWWAITVRLGHRKYEGDLYFLGARYRIATLEEQLARYTTMYQQARDELYDYQDRYGSLDSPSD